MKRLEVVTEILCGKCFDNTGKVVYQQAAVPKKWMKFIIWTLDDDIMQGHRVSKKIYDLRQKNYCPNLADKVQSFINSCQICIRSKRIAKDHLRPPRQKIYDPRNGPRDLLEFSLVGQLLPSNGYTYILIVVDLFSKYILAILLGRPDAQSVVKGLMTIITRHAYVPKTILTDKGTAFFAEVVNSTMEQAGISI